MDWLDVDMVDMVDMVGLVGGRESARGGEHVIIDLCVCLPALVVVVVVPRLGSYSLRPLLQKSGA